MRSRDPIAVLATLATLAVAGPAAAAIEAGVEFADDTRVEITGESETLALCSTGLLRYKLLFKGFAAALYRADCTADASGPLPAQRLELSYFWEIEGDRLGRAAEEQLRRSLSRERYDALAERIERLHASYRTVRPGDRYALTWLPGVGTELSWNDEPLVLIEGEDFARSYFGLWLGEDPLDEKLRDQLMTRRDELASKGVRRR